MSKRYTFFRMPTGKLYKGTDGKHAPTHLLSDIGTKARANPDGGVSWDGLMMAKLTPALRSSFAVVGPDDEELNETDAWGVVWRALAQLVKKTPGKPVAPAELIAEADRAAAAFFRGTEAPYVLVSSLSVERLPAKSVSVGGCTVSQARKRAARFPLPEVLGSHGPRAAFAEHLNASRYLPVKVATKGRSIHEATDKGLNALNLLRGLWSLFATFGSWTISGGSPTRKPLGVIHTGPVHTLHHPDGRAADENLYWYDPDYTEDRPLFQDKGRWPKIEKARRSAMIRMAALDYRTELHSLLVRYAVALDQPNPDLAFLLMWGILEKVTDTVGANYDETIRRTVWQYTKESRPVAKDMLEALRYRRNQYVHSGRSGEDGDQVGYLIKTFIDPHLAKLIANPYKVGSLEEYGEFLALPTDVATLEERRRRFARAIRALTK